MRIDVHVVDVQPTAALKEYTQRRLCSGLHEHAQRLLCAGVWLTECTGAGEDEVRRFVCRIDLWLRQIGPVTVRHAESNPYVAVDLAVARMRHKVSRRIRRALQAEPAGVARELRNGYGRVRFERTWRRDRTRPRHAVLIERRGSSAASSAAAWLSRHYGVEQLASLTVTDPVWDAAADGDHERLESLRDRLALSLLGRPMLVVILGSAGERSADAVNSVSEQARVRALADAVREWALPVEVIGLWIDRDDEPQRLTEPHGVPADRELDERPAAARRAGDDDKGRDRAHARVDREELVPCG